MLAIDLFCGLGGWAEGLMAEEYDVVGFDCEQHEYGEHCYPAQLVLQDVLTLDGRQFAGADLIVASPPCQEYSYMAMPWTRARQIAQGLRGEGDFPDGYTGSRTRAELTALFDACFRIQREASEAAGRHVPMVVENVCGAQPWVGRAKWRYGSYYLWGDVPALMPYVRKGQKRPVEGTGRQFCAIRPDQIRDSALKNPGGLHQRDGHPHTRRLTNPAESAIKCGGDWFNGKQPSDMRHHSSKSTKRKMASALIAKIPLELARHIGRVYAS